MDTYLGCIDVVLTNYTFVNFKPLYSYENGQFSYLTPQERQELLPESEYSNIYFYSNNQVYKPDEHFLDGEYLLFDFTLDELEPNINGYTGARNRTGYKIDVSNLPADKIRHLSEIGYYQLIKSSEVKGNYRTTQIIPIDGIGLYESQEVVLQIGPDLLLGPYTVGFRLQDSQYYVNTNLKDRKYVVSSISFNDNIVQHIQKFGNYDNERQYVCISNNCDINQIDVITNELLLQSFRDSLLEDCFDDGKLDLSDIDKLMSSYNDSLLVGETLSADVQNQRLERLRTLLTDEDNLQDTFDFIAETVSALLLKYKDAPQFSSLLNAISNDRDFMSKIQGFKIINDRIADREVQADELSRTLISLRKEIDDQRAQDIAANKIAEYQGEIDKKAAERTEIEAKIVELQTQLQVLEEGVSLQDRLKQLTEDVDYKEKRERELDDKIKMIEDRLDAKFSNSTEKALDFAFDGMLTNRMLQQAADWESTQKVANFSRVIEKLSTISPSSIEGDNLVAYMCEKVAEYRPDYDRNTIINIMICLSQGLLTVFSGEPGTGKTSICNIIAHVLGLTVPRKNLGLLDDEFNPNRYITISVERGWTTKRDFIGYYNPLTKAFDKSNRGVFDAFRMLDYEANSISTDLPFVLLLDEANLSPMEYYWADFMNICDDRNENSNINLGENYCFHIPESLRFLATINNDHTTETLSPRLIDRAWIVRLPLGKLGSTREVKFDYAGIKQVSWRSISSTFCANEHNIVPIAGEAKEIYENIVSRFRKERAAISPRTDNAIRKYWSVAQALFENETDYATDASIVALDYAIAQKILPQINGSGEHYHEFLDTLRALCKEKNLRLSEEILTGIIVKGDGSMKYYQFFG